ncbi:D-2-hydroxyglutarate dehydrogenase YdiJ [Algicola sagamiensis]|uniref:D-2-hydroxyglutarate dehydrogenase YdiJ n=1 Tax=Algicola sagamiensis TaxID=163869 RepID=UPI000365281E|nr:FAD-binding and (Fe-S)-binding domain-containing protein [Algicola sagamiensis]
MIPKISIKETLDSKVSEFLDVLRQKGFCGELDGRYSSRLTMATDNSIYQSLPQAVIFPKSQYDIVLLTQIANLPEFSSITFSPRGGGTGTNGQSLTQGVVVDLSRHMNQILEINPEEGWVRVQTGVVKDQLNEYLKQYGFFFAPDLSTSNRATIGGMVNTDASGQGSLVYGKTSDHVLELETVLIDGTVLKTHDISVQEAEAHAHEDSFIGQIYTQVLQSCRENRDKILQVFPRLNRFLTGYDLEHVFNSDLSRVNLSRLITGSEGTLGFVTEAKLNITPIPTFKTLVNVKYNSFESALRNAPLLVKAEATSVETVDSRVLNLAKEDVIWHSVSDLIQDVPNQEMDGLNIVEYNSESQEEIDSKLSHLTQCLDDFIQTNQAGVIGYQVTSDLASIQRIYAMRKKAVGLLGNAKGTQKPIAFAEDTAVPPENLADFIMAFRDLLDAKNLDYGMFGHVDAGVLHVRPALDMCDPQQEVLLREISDEVVALTAKYGGLMWGEHGKGYRSEYGEAFFGEELFLELRKIKGVFDPDNRVNPGKICTPFHSDAALVSVDDKKRGFYDRQIPVSVREDFPGSMNCNGNGLCFNFDVKSPMCPSSKVTRDRRHSPKGRAGLMREWLRLLSEKGENPETIYQQTQYEPIWKNLITRIKNAKSEENQDDFSHEVFEAMNGCLACKACSTACPIKVDVPDFRARFLNLYHTRYARPLKDYLVASIESSAPWMAKAANLVNKVTEVPFVKKIIEQKIGYIDAPKLSVPTLQAQLEPAHHFSFETIAKLSQEERSKAVLIVQDPFTSFYEAELVVNTVRFLEHQGFKPFVLPFKPNGKAQHVKGFLKTFYQTAKSAAEFLNDISKLDIPMLGLDASLVLCYRDEYLKILGQERGDFHVFLLHEWLAQQTLMPIQSDHQQYYLLGHCTEKSALPQSAHAWKKIYQTLGISLNEVSVGCCGMAGTYGHEKEQQENSKSLYEMSWAGPIEKHGVEHIVATGFSCRCQVKRMEGMKPKHPIEVALQHIQNQ